MNHRINNIFSLIMLFIVTSTAYGQDWLWKIVPLQTNISDVKKMFAVTPKMYGSDQLNFILDGGKLIIGFSPDKCVETSWGRWNVEKGTVLDITFYPDKGRKPTYYNLRKNGMRQGYDQGHITYSSDEMGLYYSVEFGKVSGIHIYPAKKFKGLKCEEEIDSN